IRLRPRRLARPVRVRVLGGTDGGVLQRHRGFEAPGLQRLPRHRRPVPRGASRRFLEDRRMKQRLATLGRRARHALGSSRLWSALGVLSASVILVNVNVLCARFYERWDWTQTESFTLSSPTTKLLES